MAPAVSRLESAFSHCEALVREQDPDRYWSSLFAPADKRPYLFALYAFSIEISRVRDCISAPLPGEIRYQWWRDVLDGITSGDPGDYAADGAAHPIAEALIATIMQFQLPIQALHDLIDARVFDLYDDMMPSLNDLEGYCGETSSVLFRLASIILCNGNEPGGADVAGHAGVSYAITGLLRALPWHLRRGQVFLPADILAKSGLNRDSILASTSDAALLPVVTRMRDIAQAHFMEAQDSISAVAPEARAAFLPIATIPAYLSQTKRRGYAPRRSLINLPQWHRLWTIWRASRRWRAL